MLKPVLKLSLCLSLICPIPLVANSSKGMTQRHGQLPHSGQKLENLILSLEEFQKLTPEKRGDYYFALLALTQIIESSQNLMERKVGLMPQDAVALHTLSPESVSMFKRISSLLLPEAQALAGLLLRATIFGLTKAAPYLESAGAWTLKTAATLAERAGARQALAAARVEMKNGTEALIKNLGTKGAELLAQAKTKSELIIKEAEDLVMKKSITASKEVQGLRAANKAEEAAKLEAKVQSENHVLLSRAQKEAAEITAKAEKSAQAMTENSARAQKIGEVRFNKGPEGVKAFRNAEQVKALEAGKAAASKEIVSLTKEMNTLTAQLAKAEKRGKDFKLIADLKKRVTARSNALSNATARFKKNGGLEKEFEALIAKVNGKSSGKLWGFTKLAWNTAASAVLTEKIVGVFYDESNEALMSQSPYNDSERSETAKNDNPCIYGLWTSQYALDSTSNTQYCPRPLASISDTCNGKNFLCPSMEGQSEVCIPLDSVTDLSKRCNEAILRIARGQSEAQVAPATYTALAGGLKSTLKSYEATVGDVANACDDPKGVQGEECKALTETILALQQASQNGELREGAKTPEDATTM